MRWDPFNELTELQRELNRLFEDWWPTPSFEVAGYPPVELSETEDHYIVRVLVPGLKKEDLDVEIQEGTLAIRGEFKADTQEGFVRRERPTGSFTRYVNLDQEVDVEKIEAKLQDGLLVIRLPKKETARRKKISIN